MFNPFFRSLLVRATMICRRVLSRRCTARAKGKAVLCGEEGGKVIEDSVKK
jgi:hypothetical protein